MLDEDGLRSERYVTYSDRGELDEAEHEERLLERLAERHKAPARFIQPLVKTYQTHQVDRFEGVFGKGYVDAIQKERDKIAQLSSHMGQPVRPSRRTFSWQGGLR